jgi:hypothetical protein
MISTVRSQFSKFATRLLLASALLGAVSANNAHAQMWATARASSPLIGSWLTTYQVPAFGGNTPLLLSFTGDGIVIETDTPTPTPLGGSIGTVVFSNGHGAWKQTGERTFAFTYRKRIFHTDGSSYGVSQTNGTITVSPDGTQLQITLNLLELADNEGDITFSTTANGTATRIVVAESN